MAGGVIFKGTIGTGGTVAELPSPHSTGWMYKVVASGVYAGQSCEIGDMIICLYDGEISSDTDWVVVQGNTDRVVTNVDGATAGHIAVFSDASGLNVEDSGYTIAKNVPSDAIFTDTTYSFEIDNGTLKIIASNDNNTDLPLPKGTLIAVVDAVPQSPTNTTLYVVEDSAHIVKSMTYVEDSDTQYTVSFGTSSDNVSVNDTTLTATLTVLQDASHTHANKNVLDNIDDDTVITWNSKADAVHNEGFIGGLGAALLSTGGGAIGSAACASKGLAGGANAATAEGFAGGSGSSSSHGAAAGRNSKTLHGVALGDGAQTVDEEGNPITAIQLGSGTNSVAETMQVYNYLLLNSTGQIPAERLSDALLQLNTDSHTHTNKSIIDSITGDDISAWNQVSTLNNSIGVLSALETTDKSSVVNAINEITVPISNNMSSVGTQTLELENGLENRLGEVTSLTLNIPSPIPDDYMSILSFTSGETATSVDYGDNIKWVRGSTDVIDGVFVPIPNSRYTIVVRYDGVNVCGEVGGVTIESSTN